jgi:nicotinamide-nucleotide amidase
MPTAVDVVGRLQTSGRTVATAESITGGLVGAALTAVPGASSTYRGGIVAYATEVKASVLGVDPDLLEQAGAVDARVCEQMAEGTRQRIGATFGLATTGVAGPEPQDGKGVGTVFVAVAGPRGVVHRRLQLNGGRAAIRTATVDAVLSLLQEQLAG